MHLPQALLCKATPPTCGPPVQQHLGSPSGFKRAWNVAWLKIAGYQKPVSFFFWASGNLMDIVYLESGIDLPKFFWDVLNVASLRCRIHTFLMGQTIKVTVCWCDPWQMIQRLGRKNNQMVWQTPSSWTMNKLNYTCVFVFELHSVSKKKSSRLGWRSIFKANFELFGHIFRSQKKSVLLGMEEDRQSMGDLSSQLIEAWRFSFRWCLKGTPNFRWCNHIKNWTSNLKH